MSSVIGGVVEDGMVDGNQSIPIPPRPLRRPSQRRKQRAISSLPPHHSLEAHETALQRIRHFLKGRSSYDVFPVSFRLIVLDTKLEVKKALSALMSSGVVSAPLWNGDESCFAGMFTVQDIIHLIQYYYDTSSYEGAAADVEHFRLESLREIERALNVPPPPLLYIHPLRPLYDACQLLIQTHARRLPLLDRDQQTGDEVVLSVLTQYRVLKFIAINCKDVSHLHMSLRSLGIGTYVTPSKEHPNDPYYPIATANLNTTVFDVVHMFSERGISAVPIINEEGMVLNLYETVDVITLVRLGAYQSLDLTVSAALSQRSPDFPGVVTCTAHDSLASLLLLIRQRRVHRLVVIEGDADSKGRDRDTSETPTDKDRPSRKGRLAGIISLSDVLKYVVGQSSIVSGAIGEAWEDQETEGEDSIGDRSETASTYPGFQRFGYRGETDYSLQRSNRSGNEYTPTHTTPSLSTPNTEPNENATMLNSP